MLVLPLPTILRTAAVFAILSSTLPAQESGEPPGEGKPVMLWVLCQRPAPGASELKIVQDGKILDDLPLAAPLTSEPLGVGRGDLLLARLNDTRWPLSKSARVFLFFIPDPERRSVGYQSFREYTPLP